MATGEKLRHEDASGGVAQAKEQAHQKADEVRAKASDRLRSRLDERSTDLGGQIGSVAQALHRAGEHLQHEGNDPGAKAAHQAGDQAQRLATYLTNSSSDRFLGDVERFGRERPWAAGAVGAALGFLGARFLKASSETRYSSTRSARADADLPVSRDTDTTAAFAPLSDEDGVGGL